MSTRTARSLGPDLVLAGTVAKRAEILVVGLTSGPDGPEIALSEGIVDEDVLAEILDSLIAVGATGKPEQLTRVPAPSALSVTSVLAVGAPVDAIVPVAERVARWVREHQAARARLIA